MRSKFEDMLTEDERKMVRHWTIGATVFYGVVLLGMVGLIAVNAPSGGSSDQVATYYDLDGFSPTTVGQGQSEEKSTSGVNISEINASADTPKADPETDKFVVEMFNSPTTYSAAAPSRAQAPAASARVPVPEVDELEPDAAATAEAPVAPSPTPESGPQQTAQSRK